MKTLILLAVALTICKADTSATSAQEPTKTLTKNTNTIPITQKPQTYYAMPIPQNQPPYIQYVQKPLNVLSHQPQATMLIIAQPALVPQHMLLGQAAQQLLNYFYNNPQARYQFLHGGHYPQPLPHPTAQSYVPQALHSYNSPHYTTAPASYSSQPSYTHHATSPSIGSYQLIAAPSHYSGYGSAVTNLAQQGYSNLAGHASQSTHTGLTAPSSSHVTYTQTNSQPTTLNQIAHYATSQAQQYQQPIRTAPPIITGFENFSPEQQVQIKEQLSAHLGGGTLTQLNGNSVQASNQLQTFGSKYQTQGQSNDFTPSQQIDNKQEGQQSPQTNEQQQQQQQRSQQLPQASALTQSQASVYRAQYKRG